MYIICVCQHAHLQRRCNSRWEHTEPQSPAQSALCRHQICQGSGAGGNKMVAKNTINHNSGRGVIHITKKVWRSFLQWKSIVCISRCLQATHCRRNWEDIHVLLYLQGVHVYTQEPLHSHLYYNNMHKCHN